MMDAINVSEVLEAMEAALYYLSDALDEMKGIQYLKTHYDALTDVQYELLKDKEVLDAAEQTEHQRELDEMTREFYQDKL